MSSGVPGGLTANKFQTHALRDAASGLGVMSPDTYLNVVSAAQENFLARMSQLASEQYDDSLTVSGSRLDDMPQLAVPGERGISASADVHSQGSVCSGDSSAPTHGAAALTALLGKVMSIISSNSIAKLQQNAAIWNQLTDAVKNQLDALNKEVDDATQAASDAADAAEAADKNATQAEADAAAADKAAEQAEQAYQEKKSSGASGDELKPYKDDAEKKRTDADKADASAKQARADANDKKDAAAAAATKAANAEAKADCAVDDVTKTLGPKSPIKASSDDAAMRGAAALTEIFAKVQELISKGNLDELSSKQRVFQEMQAQREESLKKKSDEYQEQVKKAEQMQKTMGCVGKVLGWLVTAVSVVAAAFTGGASLALAAVGLALAVGDEICKAATGVSFMDKIMQPIMDAILKPMMSFFAQQITKALEACGVDKDKAEIAGAIIGAVVTGVALVAAAVIGSSLIKSIASKVADLVANQLAKVMDSTIGKALLNVLEKASEKSGLQAVSSRTATAMGRLRNAVGIETQEDEMLVVNRLERVNVGMNLANQSVQAAGSIVVGIEENRAMQTLAAVKMALTDLKMIGELLKQAVTNFAEHNRVLGQLLQDMTDAAGTEASTGSLILRNVRAA
ncbi:translocator protein BipB [Burkholderia sp. ABCPW 14]|uniref:type III secretion system translocon subunit SctE n=1 Tax=Burkholderia sp. ABCPW 14 TaxID=1637860 RepID=UPI000770CD32|nr:type III secretion system translocon subunit SctE [Burkholderia sp. ABCPW 14]KVD78020.1 translocator protein BipB [Burkholderia sp. ABCPW 14]